MEKKIKKIFNLPPFLTIAIAVPSFILVAAVLVGKIVNPIISYLSYALSAYALVIKVTGMIKIVRAVKKMLLSVHIVRRIIEESTLRTEIALYSGVSINVIYVILKTSMGIYYKSAWFISLGVYYLALAIMRFSLIHYFRFEKKNSDRMGELRRYRMCGYMLFVINAALVGMIILVVKRDAGFVYPGYLIYVMAMYTFYAVVTAVVNLVKYRRYGSPVMSAAKVINLSTALVSLFSLETAMLSQFGGEQARTSRCLWCYLQEQE